VRNLYDYVANWKPQPQREVVYDGSDEGSAYLRSVHVPFTPYDGHQLDDHQLLIVGPAASHTPAAPHVLALGVNAFPGVTFDNHEYISSYFAPFPSTSPFAGISPAETHNRDPRTLPLIDGQVLASTRGAIFSQLAPWQFRYNAAQMNIKRTFRKISVMTARILGNQGVSPHTTLLSHFANGVRENEHRWLDGLYTDVPEEWDDPYRFFRW